MQNPPRSSQFHTHIVLGILLLSVSTTIAQVQNYYAGSPATGQLILTTTVNPVQIGSTQSTSQAAIRSRQSVMATNRGPEAPRFSGRPSRPMLVRPNFSVELATNTVTATSQSLTINSTAPGIGFNGVSHADQRLANSGNQLSVEPPNASIAVANGYVLEGVNNGVRIFTTSGNPVMQTIASNQMYGLPAEYNRTTDLYGPYPTDMRVFFDSGINRWFVLQRSLDNDQYDNTLNTSHLYMAVSQTSDPTQAWNVYVMDTTNSSNYGCPCFLDFPQIGADAYGFYVSANEYSTSSLGFVDATILAISKAGLGAGASTPTMTRFTMGLNTGYEFSIQPATTPPGASSLLANGGGEYFVSTEETSEGQNGMGVWVMTNTASLQSSNPNPSLTQTVIPILNYVYPGVAQQKTGPIPYGSSLTPPGTLPFIDGGEDSRILSAVYAGGRLFTTFSAQVRDNLGNTVQGGCYVILSPTLRANQLSGIVLQQGYLSVQGNSLLRPAITVNAQGNGVIAATLVGPSYYPTAAFAPINLFTTPTTLYIASAGTAPEDGFTGYAPQPTAPIARWGDYSTAVTSPDGSLWMVTEFIPNTSRTVAANWGTYIAQYVFP
jgi:hypothetical protein